MWLVPPALTPQSRGIAVSSSQAPLSMASMASMNCRYTARYTVSTDASEAGLPISPATISSPKCLYTRPALDSFVSKPAGRTRSLSGSQTGP